MTRAVWSVGKRIWALPWTLFGLAIGLVALASGGHVRRYRGTLGFAGGGARTFLRSFPFVRGASAMALGHVVLGQTDVDLDMSYDHELVHVRQYERWGPFFLPAYAAASLLALARGGHAYDDNWFELEARHRRDP